MPGTFLARTICFAALLALYTAQICPKKGKIEKVKKFVCGPKQTAACGQDEWILSHQACIVCGGSCSSFGRENYDKRLDKKLSGTCPGGKKPENCGPKKTYQRPEEAGGDQSRTGVACNAEACQAHDNTYTQGETCRVQNVDTLTKFNVRGLDLSHSKKCPPGTVQIAVAACGELGEFNDGKASYQQQYVCKVTAMSVKFVQTSDTFAREKLTGYYEVVKSKKKPKIQKHTYAHMLELDDDNEYEEYYADGFDDAFDDGGEYEEDIVSATSNDSSLSSTGTQMLMFAMYSLSVNSFAYALGAYAVASAVLW
eukprot:CAMPEP_0202695962 /NCGR_PEP_ID=MMETSP1385-20130828/9379_1 /ASSEMBLY_ACC=CAM_ASM_000861 /TAXON_ID=933848 /ORGANISM="Elphidium margaritaceum" /LENGTH=310 /DNA_ID=CAMNT_0049352051 /DNA_START=16 /DNA_END=946 /DNA_ORIENTATION=-